MAAGSVIVDMGASALGGNVARLRARRDRGHRPMASRSSGRRTSPRTVPHGRFECLFPQHQRAAAAHDRSDGALQLDTTDEIQAGVVITRDGEVVHPAVAKLLQDNLLHEGASNVDRPGH